MDVTNWYIHLYSMLIIGLYSDDHANEEYYLTGGVFKPEIVYACSSE